MGRGVHWCATSETTFGLLGQNWEYCTPRKGVLRPASEGKRICQQKATIKWGITSEKMCVNICKGGEVEFDWGHNTLNDGATTQRVRGHQEGFRHVQRR